MNLRLCFFSLIAVLGLHAQDYHWLRVVPGSKNSYCPREEIDAEHFLNSAQRRDPSAIGEEWVKSGGEKFFPKAERRDASGFTCYDEKGKAISLASLKGKVVVIGLWASRCEPSIYELADLAQIQPKGEKMGFVVLPCHMESWPTLNLGAIRRSNPTYFKDTKFFKAGLGKEGVVTNLSVGKDLTAMPTTVIVDQEGKVAYVWNGHAENRLVVRLSQILKEANAAPAPAEGSKPH